MRIADHLKAANLTLTEFARRAGVSVAAMSRYASGQQIPRPEAMRRIAEASDGAIGPADFYATPEAESEPDDPVAAARLLFERQPDLRWIDLVIPDTNGIFRGKRVPRDEAIEIIEHGLKLVGSLYGLDILGDNVEETGLAMATGDRDQIAVPVDGRILPMPWVGEPAAQMLMTMLAEDGTPFFADPRQVLVQVLGRFDELGLTPMVACELEFYLIDRERTGEGGPQPARSPYTGRRDWSTQVLSLEELDAHRALLSEASAALDAQGVPATSSLSEYAPGQFEINLHHVADARLACDHAMLMKRAVRGVARARGLDATFMAKPYRDLAGSGLHIHVSLLDAQGRNLFAGPAPEAELRLRHAVGGLMASLPEAIAVLAPNANSYRRFKLGSYAPTGASWGVENRTVSLRVLGGEGQARRIEHRVAGADANPYLVMAAVLAGIHHGLVEKRDPGAPVDGNAYDKAAPSLARHWAHALDAYDDGRILPRYFGERYHQHFGALKRIEFERYETEVSPLDHAWYLDRL